MKKRPWICLLLFVTLFPCFAAGSPSDEQESHFKVAKMTEIHISLNHKWDMHSNILLKSDIKSSLNAEKEKGNAVAIKEMNSIFVPELVMEKVTQKKKEINQKDQKEVNKVKEIYDFGKKLQKDHEELGKAYFVLFPNKKGISSEELSQRLAHEISKADDIIFGARDEEKWVDEEEYARQHFTFLLGEYAVNRRKMRKLFKEYKDSYPVNEERFLFQSFTKKRLNELKDNSYVLPEPSEGILYIFNQEDEVYEDKLNSEEKLKQLIGQFAGKVQPKREEKVQSVREEKTQSKREEAQSKDILLKFIILLAATVGIWIIYHEEAPKRKLKKKKSRRKRFDRRHYKFKVA